MECREVLVEATRQLASAGVDSAELDAEVLLAYTLGINRGFLLSSPHHRLSAVDRQTFDALLDRRRNREPTQYLTGKAEFWSLPFQVDSRVMVPRPETEVLVEEAMNRAGHDQITVLDLGTGSGCIAAALAKERPDITVMASDVSPAALAVARENLDRLGLLDRVQLLGGDLFSPFAPPGPATKFDLIVSNPPYIPEAELEDLMPEVAAYEPRLALVCGGDGLDITRRIIEDACPHLEPGGALLLEMAAGRADEVRAIFSRHPGYRDILVRRDYAGHERVIRARWTRS